jgi:hypothetical protein
LQNSVDGRLNTPQLRLAYAALVRSASTISLTSSGAPDNDKYTLAWYCVQLILDTIKELSPAPRDPKGKGKAKARTEDVEKSPDRVHRLHLMLISTISSLPLPLMLRALDETRRLITAYPADDSGAGALGDPEESGKVGKAELLEALFRELLEKTGDQEKEVAIRWWYKHRSVLLSETSKGEEKGMLLPWFKGRKTIGGNEQREPKDLAREENPSNPSLSRL